ncbi:hypothetical protein EV715DRAFT_264017 [Schizophyllum commune]
MASSTAKPLGPSAAANTMSLSVSAFQNFLADNATKHPDNTSYERRQAIEKAFENLRVDLPKIYVPRHVVKPKPSQPESAPASRSPRTCPPKRIDACYKWLVNHLHNPYPTREEREDLARQSGSDVKSITAWFVTARQRIGWSNLRATRFQRSQVLIVEAASKFWPERNTRQPLEPDLELRFAEIDANTRSMYSEEQYPSVTLMNLLKEHKPSSVTIASNAPSKKRKLDEPADHDGHEHKRRRSASMPQVTSTSDVPPERKIAGTRRKRVPSNPSPPTARHDAPALSLTTNVSPTPKFGEPSLSSPSPKNPLKRTRSDDDAREAKRPHLLPVWNDPRARPRAVSHSGVKASSTSRKSPSAARRVRSEAPPQLSRSASTPIVPTPSPWDDDVWSSLFAADTSGVQEASTCSIDLPLPDLTINPVNPLDGEGPLLPCESNVNPVIVQEDVVSPSQMVDPSLPTLCSTPSSTNTDFSSLPSLCDAHEFDTIYPQLPSAFDSTCAPIDGVYAPLMCPDYTSIGLAGDWYNYNYLDDPLFMLGANLQQLPVDAPPSPPEWEWALAAQMPSPPRMVDGLPSPSRKRSLDEDDTCPTKDLPAAKRVKV